VASGGSTALVELIDGAELVAAWPLATVIDLATVDTLARLQLAARSVGWSIRIRNAGDELASLVELVGLSGVLRLEPRR
jgi:hypothetical protein